MGRTGARQVERFVGLQQVRDDSAPSGATEHKLMGGFEQMSEVRPRRQTRPHCGDHHLLSDGLHESVVQEVLQAGGQPLGKRTLLRRHR